MSEIHPGATPFPPSAHRSVDCAHGVPLHLICGACTPQLVPLSIDATLAERGSRYGDFPTHAKITQAIKSAMQDSPNWQTLASDQKEAFEMTAHKIGRILNGDPDFHDSWHDIVGYVKLVADRLAPEPQSVVDRPDNRP
jgi:hypothetical protein